MATETNLEVLESYIDAFNRRDAEKLRELSTGDSEFHSAFVSGEGAGVYRGYEGILRYLSDVDDAFEEWHAEDSRFSEGDAGRVLHRYRIVGKGRGSGIPVDAQIAIVWTLQDGNVKHGKVYLDQAEAARIAGVAVEELES